MQAQEHHATAERILQVASKLFAEKGFANVSVRDICRETGTSPPVIYYYFRNKKGLFDAVARKQISMEVFIKKLSKASEAEDPKEGAPVVHRHLPRIFPGAHLRHRTLHARLCDLGQAERTDGLRGPRAHQGGGFEDGSEGHIPEGCSGDTDAGLAAECLLGMLNRVIFQHIHFDTSSDREAYGLFVKEFFLRAMK